MEVKFFSGTFLAMVVNFLILMYVLVKLLYRPIQAILEERRLKIIQDFDDAEQAKKKAEQMQEEAKKMLEESHAEAYEIVERARNEAERLREEIISQARHEADQLRQRTQTEIERAKQIARAKLKEEAVDLAFTAIKKIFGNNSTASLNESLIQRALEELDKGATNKNDLPGGA